MGFIRVCSFIVLSPMDSIITLKCLLPIMQGSTGIFPSIFFLFLCLMSSSKVTKTIWSKLFMHAKLMALSFLPRWMLHLLHEHEGFFVPDINSVVLSYILFFLFLEFGWEANENFCELLSNDLISRWRCMVACCLYVNAILSFLSSLVK